MFSFAGCLFTLTSPGIAGVGVPRDVLYITPPSKIDHKHCSPNDVDSVDAANTALLARQNRHQ